MNARRTEQARPAESCYGHLDVEVETIIRPTYHVNKEISFLWKPHECLAELVYTPRHGLRFMVKGRQGIIHAADEVQGYKPLSWVAAYAQGRGIKLPSHCEDYGSLDRLTVNIRRFIHRYFDCDQAFESVATLYVLQSWVYERFSAVPYLRFLGISGSGKSRATETIGSLCYRPLVLAGSTSAAAIFRLIEAVGGTMLIDEADFQDSQIGSDVAKILNCGYAKGTPVTRMDQTDNGYVPRPYEVYGPKILNGRKPFSDDATESRCLAHTPVLTERDDIPAQLPDCFHEEALHIRNMALAWRMEHLDAFQICNVYLAGMRRRTNQILLPLLLITELMESANAERYRRDLMAYAAAIENDALEDKRDTVEGRLIQAFIDVTNDGQTPTCKDIADRVVKEHFKDDPKLLTWLSPRRASAILKGMGFETKHSNKGAVVSVSSKRLASLKTRFGTITRSSPTPSWDGDDGDGQVTVPRVAVTPQVVAI